jgi:biopolymer transport protein ExbB/TolQ
LQKSRMRAARDSWLTRYLWLIIGMLAALAFIAVMSFVLNPQGALANVLLDRDNGLYPFTIQNFMWLLFGVGLAEVIMRIVAGSNQFNQTRIGLLPEDDTTMLRAEDLGAYAAAARRTQAGASTYFLQELVIRVIFQFQAGRSVAQANDVFNSSLELHQHELGLRYSLLRYLVWLIPTVGFIGTVVGIAAALDTAGSPPDITDADQLSAWMSALTGDLGIAFDTTLIALILSAILVFLMHVAEEREEGALNAAGQYCLDNLINRLYER